MRGIIYLLVVAATLAVLTVATAAPALARPEHPEHPTCCSTYNSARSGDNPPDVGYHVVGINNGGRFNIHSHPKWG